MTEEQIKQNAEVYADKLYEDGRCTESTAPTIQEIYIAGAHSRDEEIKELRLQRAEYEDKLRISEHHEGLLREEVDAWMPIPELKGGEA